MKFKTFYPLLIILLAVGLLFITQVDNVEASDAYFCNQGQDICLDIEFLLPQPHRDALQLFQATNVYTEINNQTHIEMSIDSLPAGITEIDVVTYLNDYTEWLRNVRAQTKVVPILFGSNTPQPYCIRDTDGSKNGIYSVNGLLQMVNDDPVCYGICDVGVCPPFMANEPMSHYNEI